jgi:hypothetical protein
MDVLAGAPTRSTFDVMAGAPTSAVGHKNTSNWRRDRKNTSEIREVNFKFDNGIDDRKSM